MHRTAGQTKWQQSLRGLLGWLRNKFIKKHVRTHVALLTTDRQMQGSHTFTDEKIPVLF